MAEFCEQCAESLGFPGDFRGLYDTPELLEDLANDRYFVVLCEGCGPCQVDEAGRCISSDCYRQHGEKR